MRIPQCLTEGCSNAASQYSPLGSYCTRCSEEMEAIAEHLQRAEAKENYGMPFPFKQLSIGVALTILVFVMLSIGAQLGRGEENKRWVNATGCKSSVGCVNRRQLP